jgi:putative ubiquitin-RnfH superfamily antitoxin RatB of RatAB toxin-antitoxin module
MIAVQVCYAKPGFTFLRDLQVAAGTTIEQAIAQSGVLQAAPEIDFGVSRVAIYNKLKTLDTVLREHDRVEICRPLIADPKESRRLRAKKRGPA